MQVVAIIQARMGSTRLPGKALMDLAGKTVLARVVERVSRMNRIQSVVVATSVNRENEPIAVECGRLGIHCFRGSEYDVLDRYAGAAREYKAEAIVRITADCPLIDPEISDSVVSEFVQRRADYASNIFPRTYPRGLDTEVFTRDALEQAWKHATEAHQREHVTPYLYEHPQVFRLASIQADAEYAYYRWTLDTQEDLELIRSIYSRFDGRERFSWRELLQLFEREPALVEINSHVQQAV
jgi:spore coat polysaccharide biosynthesis protein SpsF